MEEFKPKMTKIAVRGRDYKARSSINQYSFVKKIGEGTSAKVKLAIAGEKEEKFAIKIFNREVLKRKKQYQGPSEKAGNSGAAAGNGYKDAMQDAKQEIELMKKVNHPNIIKLHELIDDEEDENIYLVMDYMGKGPVIEWSEERCEFYRKINGEVTNKRFSEEELKKIFYMSLKGLEHMHSMHIVHRDLKPQNILENENGIVKIGDLGSVAILSPPDENVTGSVGTYHFMAPESFKKESHQQGYNGYIADVWALGVCLYSYAFFKLPFFDGNLTSLVKKIEGEPFKFPEKNEYSKEFKDLLTSILCKNPLKRLTIQYESKDTH